MSSRGDHALTIAVVGGAGAMGRIAVRDLVETAGPGVRVVVADYNLGAARRLARAFDGRVRAVRVDAVRVTATARALKGAFAIINCSRHEHNLPVMEAALRAGAHYCDLGGLFHVTRKQLTLHARFQRAGLLAVPGIGAAPGVVNVLARAAADGMDRVDEIHVLVGNVDRTPGRDPGILAASYSIQTILDEASLPAAIFSNGRFAFVEPMSDPQAVQFPEPVGLRHPARTLHSEVATLPLSYRAKGVREVSFRIAFPDGLAERLRFLRALGMTSTVPVPVGRARVAPRDLLSVLHQRLPAPAAGGPPDEYEVLRVVVRGARAGAEVEEVVDCHASGIPAWGVGVDVDTGCPPSIAMQLLAGGVIDARGVVPPEQAIPVRPFFAELEKRGMRIDHRRARSTQMLGSRSGRGAVSAR
jgi:saccharopine dehydrogenase-like NADP-dependent oxidoreductase